MGKRRRNQRRREKALQKPQELTKLDYKDWFRGTASYDQRSQFVAHRGDQLICHIDVESFNFERQVTPYREMGSMQTRHFSTGMASCTGRINPRRLTAEQIANLLGDPFEITMAQNNQITARAQCAVITQWKTDEYLEFTSRSLCFEPEKPKEKRKSGIPRGYVSNHYFWNMMGRTTPSVFWNGEQNDD